MSYNNRSPLHDGPDATVETHTKVHHSSQPSNITQSIRSTSPYSNKFTAVQSQQPTTQLSTSRPIFDPDKPIKIGGYEVYFPFQPYPTQLSFMNHFLSACNKRSNALLESPTGSGKTLSLLCAALAWQRKQSIEYNTMSDARNPLSDQLMMSATGMRVNDIIDEITSSNSNDELNEYDPLNDLTQMNNDPLMNLTQIQLPIRSKTTEKPIKDKLKPQRRPVVYYTSRTHSQLEQVVKELKSTSYRPRMTILASRKFMCIHDDVKHSSNINDACRTERTHKNKPKCKYFDHYDRVSNHRIADHVWDIEELVDVGHRHAGCPYYASHSLMANADIVFAPYNFIISPMIRKAMSIDLTDAVVIMDESHNAEAAGRDSGSAEFVQYDIINTTSELQRAANIHGKSLPPTRSNMYQIIHDVMQKVNTWINDKIRSGITQHDYNNSSDTYRNGEMLSILNEWGINAQTYKSLIDTASELNKEQNDSNDKQYNNNNSDAENEIELSGPTRLCVDSLFSLFEFMFMYNMKYIPDYRLNISYDRNSRYSGNMEQQHKHKLSIWCMNPGM